MITIQEVRNQIEKDPENWIIYLMDFVDDFRYYKDVKAIQVPLQLSNEKFDAVLAAAVAYLCRELNVPEPDWVELVPACKEPWFISGMENLKAIALVESPLQFRIKKIFVLENFLCRI